MMQKVSLEALEAEAQYLRLCVFGEPGTGKTWLGASAALDEATAPVLFVEYRAQIASIRSNPEFIKAMKDGRLAIVTLDKYSELDHVYTWAVTGKFPESVMPSPPKTIVIDSLTELQRTEVMRKAGNPAGRFLTEIEAPQIHHWGQLLNQFTLLANKFYALPYHLVFIGLESVDYGPRVIGQAPQATGYRLALQGQAQRQFPAYALTVMRMERAPKTLKCHAIGYTSSTKSKTKEQTGCFPEKVGGPTIPKLVKMLREGGYTK